MLRSIKKKLKDRLKYRYLRMTTTNLDATNIPATLNENFNYILKLNPRVTSFQEHVSLFNLSGVTHGDVIEVGCYLGYSSVMLASAFSGEDRKLFAIDTFGRGRGWSNGGTDDWIYKEWSQLQFAQKVIDDCGLSESVVLKQGRSDEFVQELSGLQNVGLVFIDADHSYSGCMQDLIGYAPILSEGGLLVVDDYASAGHKGVKQAVDEFLSSHAEFAALFLVDVMLVIRKNVESRP